jgi:uncharacterized membrane protein
LLYLTLPVKKTFLALLFLCALAAAKSYSIPLVEVTNEVQGDGSVRVTEEITFDFRGPYSYAFREFDFSRGGELSDFTVTEGGAPLHYDWSGDKVIWHYSAQDEQRTFTLSYTLTEAVKAYDDVAEFYWRVWGDGWDRRVGRLTARVVLPTELPEQEVLAWAHPALDGSITREADGALFEVDGVPSNQWVEARVVFPRSALASVVGAAVQGGDGLQKIVEQEEAWENETRMQSFWFYLSLLCPLAILALFALLYWVYGREPETGYQGVYERETPGFSPAMAGAIMNFGVGPGDVTATLLDLVRRKHLKMTVKKVKRGIVFKKEVDEYYFEFLDGDDSLKLHERALLNELKRASKGGKVSLSEWKNHLKEEARWSKRRFFEDWKKLVEPDLQFNGYVDYTGRNKFLLYSLPFLGIPAVIALFFNEFAWFSLILSAILYGVFGFVAKKALPRRTKKGALAYEKLSALKKFLKEFSLLNEKKPQDIVLWEEYLVYATALGVADEVSKVMDASFTKAQRRRSSFYYAGSFHGAVIASTAINSAVISSVSTGRSGGFSGGGGFGGGGGGGGAG